MSRTNNGQPQSSFELGLPHEEASAWCGLPCQDQTRFIPAGSLVKATIEYLVIPADKSRYYGQSDYLNQTSVDTYRSAEMMQMLARDNQISINMITGGLLKHYPLELQANYGALAVEFSLSGGLGYIPLSIKGLNRYDGWQLQELVDGQWNLLDQSVIGNDYWQSTYDPSQDSYTLSFNLKAQALPKTYRLIWLE